MKPDKEYKGRSTIRMYNCDCMEFMKQVDEPYDLAIVDPPYGIDAGNMTMGKGIDKAWDKSDWDLHAPPKEYFDLLEENTDKVIIFGGNYFDISKDYGWIFWDKDRRKDVSFSDGELAATNIHRTIKKITYRYDGFIGRDSTRIHSTQKPVGLYKKMLKKYANEGDTILDTHGGSMSIAIACWDLGFDLDICELDTDYFNDAVKRFENHIAQKQMVFQ